MKIGVLGTGMVGTTISGKLIELGHEVMMGSRTADNENAVAWATGAGEKASHGTFATAAVFGAILFNCTSGTGTLNALEGAGTDNLNGKILIDISNPLDFSNGMPPSLFIGNTDSLGEHIQRTFQGVRVVKTLNTVASEIMVNPTQLESDHTIFLCGNDEEAKKQVMEILRVWFGWKDIIDLGDITKARGMEASLHLWLNLWSVLGTVNFNISVVRKI